ncbi:ADP-ribose pyrophosphatase [Azospirillum sp. TSH100]|uniref:NUDIX domain-containing protein n=1 Tax=Azospirillum sp. TSH100 TaxID=652764 RepID=UPI000D61A3D3|nr:NUDIX domain-containing protein [Azospirillum sp. TSH100]PWC82411.1 ADP-ribose pyrophosphatase [Azospirillum sp. TSH100]QCG87966.1 NUDIX domain-containing protein [Azospirillum sp. TSH100]
MNHPDIEILDKKTPYKGFLTIDVYRLRHKKFDGTWTDVLPPREVCDRGAAVAVLLYDPDLDTVVMIEQFRVGSAAAGGPAWMTEIVAGMVGEGETPEDVARRESIEEAGCAIREIEHICDYYVSPGAFTEEVAVFCGRVDSRNLAATGGLEEEHEDIRIMALPVDEAIRMMDENRLRNSVAIIAVGWLARHRESLRKRWLGQG